MKDKIAYRDYICDELRMIGEDGKKKLVGHAAVFNERSEDLGGWRDIIAPGAFKKTISEADIRALFNHNKNYVLGRNKSNTLRLQEDMRGLAIEIDLPDVQYARDLAVSIDRGDISGMSFAFRTVKDDIAFVNDELIRTLIEVQLFDVSPVTYPAYPQTDVNLRDLQVAQGKEPDLTIHSNPRMLPILKNRINLRR